MDEELRGSSACWLCGLDRPHHHEEYEVNAERERPRFEAAMRTMLIGSVDFRNLVRGHSMATTPQYGYGEKPFQSYPEAFGWGPFPKQKTFGGDDAYGLDHWAYRSSYGQPYRNQNVEWFWNLWREATKPFATAGSCVC